MKITYALVALSAIIAAASPIVSACGRCGSIDEGTGGSAGHQSMCGIEADAAAGECDAGAHCMTANDCSALVPGPCGIVLCDVISLVGAPPVVGLPMGCYVSVDPKCEANDAGDFCDVAADCPSYLQCPACVNGHCQERPTSDGGACPEG